MEIQSEEECPMLHVGEEHDRIMVHNAHTAAAWQPTPGGDRSNYDGPDLPTSDLPEDHMGSEPHSQPVDVSKLTKILGYEDVGHYHKPSLAPPLPLPSLEVCPPYTQHSKPEEKYASVTHITETQAREALLDHVHDNCCYGTRAAKEMQLLKVIPSCALQYCLETYTEQRRTSWEQEPYRGTGQPIDGPDNGPAPPPWEIHCNPTQTFHDEQHELEVPHTAHVMPCHGCTSLGWQRCHCCMGRGFKRCINCHGSGRDVKTDSHGHRHVESCWHCRGTGRKRCTQCSGDGRLMCRTCHGFRQLKCFIKLTVTYTNHYDEHIVEHPDVPEHLVKQVEGETIFQQTQPRLWPICNYPDEEVCIASQTLLNGHLVRFQYNSRLLMQRQVLRGVPVAECQFQWKDEDGSFFVYGKERAVYAKEYPQRYCWGCVIL